MPRRKVSQIVEEARGLPYGERTELIERLIADAAKDIDPEIEKACGDEALRRIKEMEEGKVQGIPGDVVAAKIRKIVGRE
jgi:putative addiction module component (TIGR02574 family)